MPLSLSLSPPADTKSTQWEDPRLIQKQKQAAAVQPYSRDYKLKIENLRKQLLAKKPVSINKSINFYYYNLY